MTSEQYRRVGEIYHGAMELAPEDRADFLAGACGDDEELRREVESLLQARQQVGGFIVGKVAGVVADIAAEMQIPSLIGHSISHYQVLSLLAVGGMGQVFLAEDTRLGRKVALKTLPSAFTGDPDRVRRFEQEAKAASALNQPNILTIHEIGAIDNCHFIVSEYVEGETLRQRMQKGEMTLSAALDVAVQVASARSAAHAAGITHRDIKPENVMARPDGLVKVLDFGLAKLSETQSPPADSQAPTLGRLSTEPGVLIGTVSYMSPEQARGSKVDHRTDIFSLGVMLYEMAAGRRPFEGETTSDVIAAILQNEPPPLTAHGTNTPHELERIVAKALRKDREERYQAASELLADLKGLRQRLELESLSGQSRDGEPTGARAEAGFVTRRAWLWAVAVGMIVLLIAGWLWLARRMTETPVIAVLPFKNLSDEKESDYFADGLTDELIRNLSIVEGLEVRSRTSSFTFKDKPHNLREIGEKLNVNYVLDGNVLRSGGNLRINAQFVRVSDDKILWQHKFDRELKDIFKIQDEISLGIVNELRVNLGRGRRRYETSFEAYDLYLRAENQLPSASDPPATRRAKRISVYEEVITKDPSFAPAYARLAMIHGLQSVHSPDDDYGDSEPRLRAAAEKAVQLDPLLPEAHVAIGWLRARDGQWIQAENSFLEGIRLNPNRGETYIVYADWLLTVVGRVADALKQFQQAEKVDPLSKQVKFRHSALLVSAGRYDEAAARLEQLGDDSSTLWVRLRLGQGRVAEIIQRFENVPNSREFPIFRGWLGVAYARSGRREEAEKLAAFSQAPFDQALIFAGLGDKERTLEALERLGSRGPQCVGRLLIFPEFSFLRGDPRLAALRKKVGLPQENSDK